MLRRIFSDTIFQIVFVIILGYFITPYMCQNFVQGAYTASALIKSGLVLILPIITFTYMFASMLKFARSSPLLLISILTSLQVSNVVAFLIGFYVISFAAPYFLTAGGICLNKTIEVRSLLNLSIPDMWSPSNGMLGGFIFGVIFSFIPSSGILRLSESLKHAIGFVLRKLFIPVLPIFIFGFFVKMRYEGTIEALLTGYSKVFILVTVLLFSYLFLLLLIAHGFHLRAVRKHLKCMVTPLLTAFTTMSSVAAMPLTLKCTEETLKDEDYVDFIVPFTVGIHMIGDGIVFGVSIGALIYLYSAPFPSIMMLVTFIFYYMLSKFAAAGVPAGTTAIVMPMVGKYLGFSDEMMGVFFSVCILQDCIITLGNVGGNCIFAKLSHRLFRGLMKQK